MSKNCKTFLLFASFCLLNSGIVRAETSSANILQSNWNVGGTIGFEHYGSYSNVDSSTQFSLSVNLKYFVIDHLALGLISHVTTNADGTTDTVANLGPAATYFFYSQGPLAAFLSGNIRFGLNDATLVSQQEGAVGVDYFFTPSVAFGPQFYLVHDTSHRSVNNRSNYGFELNFGIYL